MTTTTTQTELTRVPDLDLNHLFDDQENPSELTIYAPRTDDITTHWLTSDIESAVPVDTMR